MVDKFKTHPSRLVSLSYGYININLCKPATTYSSHSSRASPWYIGFFKYLLILFLKWIGTLDFFNTKIYSITLKYKSTVFSFFFLWVLSYFQLIDIAFQSQILGFLIVILSAILWIECVTRYLDKNEFIFFAGSLLCTILLILGFTLIFLDIIIWLHELLSYIYMVGSKIIKNLIGNRKATGSSNKQGSGSNKPRKNQTILTRAQKKKEKERSKKKILQDRYRTKKISKETAEETKARLAKDAQDKKDKKANETPEQRKERLARNAKALRDKKANETPEQRKARLAHHVEYKGNWRYKKAQEKAEMEQQAETSWIEYQTAEMEQQGETSWIGNQTAEMEQAETDRIANLRAEMDQAERNRIQQQQRAKVRDIWGI